MMSNTWCHHRGFTVALVLGFLYIDQFQGKDLAKGGYVAPDAFSIQTAEGHCMATVIAFCY